MSGLAPGTRLGPYEIVTPLGAGAMGEVYKARDTRLDRIVALKVILASTAATPEFRERFDREARAISAMDHPHVCTLYDVGHDNGVSYLVMQLVEGELAKLATNPITGFGDDATRMSPFGAVRVIPTCIGRGPPGDFDG